VFRVIAWEQGHRHRYDEVGHERGRSLQQQIQNDWTVDFATKALFGLVFYKMNFGWYLSQWKVLKATDRADIFKYIESILNIKNPEWEVAWTNEALGLDPTKLSI